MLSWVMGFIGKILKDLALKALAYLGRMVTLFNSIIANNKRIDKEADAVNKIVDDVKQKGSITEEQEKALREATRNLINGSFNK